jgi:predicted nuclease with TOPRIM domain
MLIRISLIVALVAGLAAGGLAFFKVADQAKAVIAARDDFHGKWDTELALRKKTQGELKKTSAELETTKATLETTRTDLSAATTKANNLEKKSADLETKLTATTAQRDEAQQKLSAYEFVGLSPDQIKATRELLAATQQERDAFVGENKILTRQIKELKVKINSLVGETEEVKLPDGLKGKILAVDPRFDFVVLNVGADQGALERGKMLVNRAGKLVGKVQIVTVEKDRCVANIMPAFKNGELMEGDEVLY